MMLPLLLLLMPLPLLLPLLLLLLVVLQVGLLLSPLALRCLGSQCCRILRPATLLLFVLPVLLASDSRISWGGSSDFTRPEAFTGAYNWKQRKRSKKRPGGRRHIEFLRRFACFFHPVMWRSTEAVFRPEDVASPINLRIISLLHIASCACVPVHPAMTTTSCIDAARGIKEFNLPKAGPAPGERNAATELLARVGLLSSPEDSLDDLDPAAVRTVMEALQRGIHGDDVKFAEDAVPPDVMMARVEEVYKRLGAALTCVPPVPDLRPEPQRIEVLSQVVAFLLDAEQTPPLVCMQAREGTAGALERRMGQMTLEARSLRDAEQRRALTGTSVFDAPSPPPPQIEAAATARAGAQRQVASSSAPTRQQSHHSAAHRVVRVKNARGNLINGVPDGYVATDFPVGLVPMIKLVDADAGSTGGCSSGGSSGGGGTGSYATAGLGKGSMEGVSTELGSLASALEDSEDDMFGDGGAAAEDGRDPSALSKAEMAKLISDGAPVPLLAAVAAIDDGCRAFKAKLESVPHLNCALCGLPGADQVPVGFGDWHKDFPSCEHHYHKRCILGMMVWYVTASLILCWPTILGCLW